MLIVAPNFFIEDNELEETFVRAAGPGGQNVNKVATAVQLRFDVQHSASLSEAIRQRVLTLAAGRLTSEGVLLIEAKRFRTQEQNRQDARARLIALLQRAAQPPKPRRATKPTRAARQKRLDQKRQRAQTKRVRRARPDEYT